MATGNFGKLNRRSAACLSLWAVLSVAHVEHATAQLRWTLQGQATVSDPVMCIAVSPTGPVYAGTVSNGVLKSTNTGTSWTGVNSGFQFANNQVISIAINGSGHLFALKLSDYIYKSTSDGLYWNRDTAGLKSWMGAALYRKRDGTLFAGFNNRMTDRNTGGVYRSTDDGASWVQTDTSMLTSLKTGFRITDVVAKSTSSLFVAMQDSGVGVFASTNNGGTWSAARSGMSSGTLAQALAVTNSGTLLCGTLTEGIYRSTNDGAGWALSNTGLTATQVNGFAITRFGLIYAATNSGVFFSADDGKNWAAIGAGITDNFVTSLCVDSSQYLLAGTTNGKVFRTLSAALVTEPPLVAPADGAANLPSPVTLSWNAVANVDGYSVDVSTDSTFASTVVTVAHQTGTTYAFNPAVLLTKFYWRVRGTWGAQIGPSSKVRSFTALGPVPDVPILKSPADSATWVQIPTTFSWKAAANAVSYRLEASHYPNFSIPVIDQSGLTDTTIGPLPGLGYGARAYWRVTAVNPAGATASVTKTFTTRGGSIPAPTPSSPSDGATAVPLPAQASWFPVAAATSYRVRISMEQYLVDYFLDTLGIKGTSFTFPRLGPSTKYYWQVASESDTLPGAWWSSIWSFTTVAGSPLDPLLKLPVNGVKDLLPGAVLFQWVPPGTVYNYWLQVANDSAFTSLVIDYPGLSDKVYSPGGTPFGTGKTYYWRVCATNGSGTGPWSAVWKFSTKVTSLPGPTLLSPANGTRTLTEPFSYNWNTVSGAASYTVQVALDSGFTNLVPGLGKTGVTAPPVSPQSSPIVGTVYYWRVNSSDGSSSGSWSPVWNFATTTGLGLPSLTLPVNGGVTQGLSAPFTWSTVTGATVYHWQLATNPGFAPVVSENTSLPSPAHTYSSVSAGTMYYWRVRAGNGTSWGPYSNTSTFTALPAFPSQHSLSTTISFPSRGNRGNYSSGDYRLFGLPGQSGLGIASLLSGKAETDWRVSWDNGNTSNWIVRYDGSSTFQCGMGRGFWLLMTGPLNIATNVPSAAMNSSLEVEIPLHGGWNIITNPFVMTLQWSYVKTANGITDPPYSFNGGSFNTASAIDPYAGYYFYNTKALSVLKMPYAGLFKPPAVEADPVDWRVTITLGSAGVTEHSTSFAVSGSAEAAAMNFRKPRGVEEVPSVWFDRPAWDEKAPSFATDVRPSGSAMESWEFTVRATAGAPAVLGFEGLNGIPAGLSIRLLDLQRLQARDLRQDSTYEYQPALATEKFTVLVGKPEEVNAAAGAILPVRYALQNPFPNPFNPAVTVPVDLPAANEITLTVHDVLGARVRTLHAGPASQGRNWFVWNGRDDAGTTVASGVYLIVLQGKQVPRLATRVVFVR